MDLFAILGDAIWIVAMAMIASSSRAAWARLPAGARLPLHWGFDRRPAWRTSRAWAFGLMVGVPLAAGLVFSAASRTPEIEPQDRLLLFLVRTATAPVFILVHMLWLRAALRTLEAEGAVKP